MQAYWNSLAQNLTFLVFLLPLMGAGLVIAASGLGIEVIRRTAMVNAILTLSLTTLLACHYDCRRASDPQYRETIQMVSSLRWLGAEEPQTASGQSSNSGKETASAIDQVIIGPEIRLAVGVDGMSLWLILLTAVMMIPAVFAGRDVDRKQPAMFYAQLLLLEASLIGLFASLDVVLFGICLEATSLFLFLLIGGWGGYERRRVVRKYLVCNLCGSLLILLGLIAIVVAHSWMTTSRATVLQPTFSIPRLVHEIPLAVLQSAAATHYWSQVRSWIFLALLIGFAVKTPLVPFHTWMPETNNEAPAAISLLFVGVAIKVGGYGFLRIVLPLFPEILEEISGFALTASVCGTVYVGLLTLGQDDVKKVMTYAALSQLGLSAAAMFTLSPAGVAGGLLQLIAQGLAAGGLAYVVGVLERHYQTRDIEAFSGLTRNYPALAFCLAFFVLSLIDIPGLGGFPGEWLSLMGMFQSSPGCVFFGLLGTLLVAWAFVWLLQRMLLGTFREPRAGSRWVGESGSSPKAAEAISTQSADIAPRETFAGQRSAVPCDLLVRELFVLAPAGVLLLCIGLCPGFFLSRINPTLSQMIPGDFPGDETDNSTEGSTSSPGNLWHPPKDEGDLQNIGFVFRGMRSVRR